jgi:hypothetical protein
MRTGAVFSTRAISTSAGRASPLGSKCRGVPAVSDRVCCGRSRKIGLQLLVNNLDVERHFDEACSARVLGVAWCSVFHKADLLCRNLLQAAITRARPKSRVAVRRQIGASCNIPAALTFL